MSLAACGGGDAGDSGDSLTGTMSFLPVPVRADGAHAHADLPPLGVWQILLITY